MTITCPSCRTSYAIPQEVLAEAQNVRCVRCHHAWLPEKRIVIDAAPSMQTPLDGEGTPSPAAQPDRAAAGTDFSDLEATINSARVTPQQGGENPPRISPTGFLHFDVDGEEAEDDSTPAAPNFAPRRDSETIEATEIRKIRSASAKSQAKKGGLFSNLAAAAVAITLFGGGLYFKDSVISAVPDLAGIYELAGLESNTQGLRFVNIETSKAQNGSIEELIIQGEVENFTTGSIKVPEIRFSVLGENAEEIYAWTGKAETVQLKGGEKTLFKSTTTIPPSDAQDLKIHFMPRSAAKAEQR